MLITNRNFRFLAICYWSSQTSFSEAKAQKRPLNIFDKNPRVDAKKTQNESRLVSCGDFVATSAQSILCDGALDGCLGKGVAEIVNSCRAFLDDPKFTPIGVKSFRQQAMAVLARIANRAIQAVVVEQPKSQSEEEGDEDESEGIEWGADGDEGGEQSNGEDEEDEGGEETGPSDVSRIFFEIAMNAGDAGVDVAEDIAEQESIFTSFLEGNYSVSMTPPTEVNLQGNMRALRNAEFRCAFNSFATSISAVLPFQALLSMRPEYLRGEWSRLHELFYKCLVLLRAEGTGDRKPLCNTDLIMELWPQLPRTSVGKPDNYQDPCDMFDILIARFPPLARFFEIRLFKPTDTSRKLPLDEVLKQALSQDTIAVDQSKVVILHIGSATSLTGRGGYWRDMYGEKFPGMKHVFMTSLGIRRQFLDAQTCKARSCDSSLTSAQRCQEYYGWARIRHLMLGQSFEIMKRINSDFATKEEFDALFPSLDEAERKNFSSLSEGKLEEIQKFLGDRAELIALVNPFLRKPINVAGPLVCPPSIDVWEESHRLVEFVLLCLDSQKQPRLMYDRQIPVKVVGSHLKSVRAQVDVNVSIHMDDGLSYQVGSVVAMKQHHFVSLVNRGDGATNSCKAEVRDCLLKDGVSPKMRESSNGVFPVQGCGAPHLIFLVPFLETPEEEVALPKTPYECTICLKSNDLVDTCSKTCGHLFCFQCTQEPRFFDSGCPCCGIDLNGFQRLVADAPIIKSTFEGCCPDCRRDGVALTRANVPCGHLMCQGCADNPMGSCSTCNGAVTQRIVVLDTSRHEGQEGLDDNDAGQPTPRGRATRLNPNFDALVEHPPPVAAAAAENPLNDGTPAAGAAVRSIGPLSPMVAGSAAAASTAENKPKPKRNDSKAKDAENSATKKVKVVSGPSAEDLYFGKLTAFLEFPRPWDNILGRIMVGGQEYRASAIYVPARASATRQETVFKVSEMGAKKGTPTKTISAIVASPDWDNGPLQVQMTKLLASSEDLRLLIIPLFEYLNRVYFENNGKRYFQNVLIHHDLCEPWDVLPECRAQTISRDLRATWGIKHGVYAEIPFDLSTLKAQHKVKFEGIDFD